jgi:2-methylcitrate dehydratase PrpD
MRPTETLAKFIASLKYADLPEEVVNKTKDTILDTLGCGLAGYTLAEEEIKPLLELIIENGGQPEATIFGRGTKTTCLNAAFLNSVIAHTIDFDDTHVPALAHFGSCTVPVALALAEKIGATGKDMITAVVAGFETGGRVGRSVMPTHYQKWHSTSTNGTIAAAGTAARLLKLSSDETEMVLGMAADQAAGGRYCLDHGDFTKSLHPGMAAFKGVLSALLVQKGAIGPRGFFEYPTGYCNVYSAEPAPDKIAENLGKPFEIMINDVKVFPSILCSHTPIQAALEIVQQNNISSEDVEKINVTIAALAKGQGCNYEPDSPLAARLSIPYCVALAVHEKNVKVECFDLTRINDPKIRALMSKVNMLQDTELNKLLPALPAHVEIITRDGKIYKSYSPYPKGSVKNPMTREEIRDKFLSLVLHTVKRSQADEIINIINQLEKFPIDKLTAHFIRLKKY